MKLATLLTLLVLSKALLLALILYGPLGLTGDEAQYWTWSQELSYGYFSKPPLIAWQIALTTALFGSTELGVRFGALVLSAGTTLAFYKTVHGSARGALTAVAFLLSPLGGVSSLFATTDGGFIFALLVAFLCFEQKSPLLTGIWIGIGGLWKWMTYTAWPFLIRFERRTVWAFFLSLLGLIPPLIWNFQHGFVTFSHVGGNIFGDGKIVVANPGEYFLGLLALLTPFFLVLAILGFKDAVQLERGKRFIYFSLCFLGASFLYACVKKCQINWGIPGLLGLFIPIGVAADRWKKLFIGAVLFSLLLQVTALLLPFHYSPFRSCLGIRNLTSLLMEIGYNPLEEYLVGDKYQTVSQLSFYSPKQKRAYFLNLLGSRENQFSYWPGLEQEVEQEVEQASKGRRGIFIALFDFKDFKSIEYWKKEYQLRLSRHFQQVQLLGTYPLYEEKGEVLKQALCIEVRGYF